LSTTHIPSALLGNPCGRTEGRAMVQKVHFGKSSAATEGRVRERGQDIK
jgi:hypothetical protein